MLLTKYSSVKYAMKKKAFIILVSLYLSLFLIPNFHLTSSLQLDVSKDVSSLEVGWNLNQINITQAWDITKGSNEIVVAVVDSGIDFSHPEIRNSRWINSAESPNNGIDDDSNGYVDDYYGWDFTSSDNNPGPEVDDPIHGHGTFIAGIIAAAHNSAGIAGIAPNVKIMNLRILDEGNWQATAALGGALYYAVDNGADIINLSIQYYANISFLHDEILYAYDHDVPMVSITGNQHIDVGGGSEMPSFPGVYEEVIDVGATNYTYAKADYSNYGNWTELVAPVGDMNFSNINHIICSIYPQDNYVCGTGTSFAAPQVAGVIALMKSVKQDLTIKQIRNILHETAIDLGEEDKDKYFGYGLLNASGAVLEAQHLADIDSLHKEKINRIIIISVSVGIASIAVIATLVILLKKGVIKV
jgi:thermitase